MRTDNKIHVLHFTKVINKNDFIDTIIRYADKEKFRMTACTYSPGSNISDPGYLSSGIPYFHTHTGETKAGFLKAIFRLRNILKAERPDILHAHHYYESLIGAAAIKLSGLPTKLVVGRHYDEELYLTTKGLKLKLYLLLEKFFNRIATRIISPSSKICDLLKKQKVPGEKIALVPYGFDFRSEKYLPPEVEEIKQTRHTLGISEDHFLIGNFARHHTIKGQNFLLMGFSDFVSEHPDSSLLMVGDGPVHEDLLALAADLEISGKVIFAGWQRNIRLLLSACDLVIHPSLQEAFPQIMIEAMSLAKPLAITPVSGATDQVKDKQTGFIIPFSDPVAITETLSWIRENESFCREVGKNARNYVLEQLDIRNIIHMYQRVYLETVQ